MALFDGGLALVTVMNIVLGVLCALAILGVLGGVIADLWKRRSARRGRGGTVLANDRLRGFPRVAHSDSVRAIS